MNDALLAILIALQVADFVTTYLALRRPGNREANPIVAKVIDALGLVPGLLVVKGSVVALLVVAAPYLSGFVLVPLLAMYVWVVINNIGVIRKCRQN